MLRPRNFAPLQRCPRLPRLPQKAHFSVTRCLRQPSATSYPTIFVPKSASSERPSFRDSPIAQLLNQPRRQKVVQNPAEHRVANPILEQHAFPQTGPLSGRSVTCRSGRYQDGFRKLNSISKENRIVEHYKQTVERIQPAEARRLLKSKRHRVRFSQGIGRLVGLALRMRNKIA
jgi:hypothetical protein